MVRGLFLEHCFGTSEAPFRFPEVILVPFEPQERDLQLWNCPRASAKQGVCLFSELPFWNVFGKGWRIWDLVLSPVRRHSGFRRSYWYHSNRKKEIYNFGIVLGLQLSKGVAFSANYLLRTCLQRFGGFWSVLGLCFVTSEPASRFPELRIWQVESEKRALQV